MDWMFLARRIVIRCGGILLICLVTGAYGENPRKPITVQRGVTQGRVVLIDAILEGKPVQLECFTYLHGCNNVRPGGYQMAPAAQGQYMDCPNIVLFEDNPEKATEIGQYCLLNSSPAEPH